MIATLRLIAPGLSLTLGSLILLVIDACRGETTVLNRRLPFLIAVAVTLAAFMLTVFPTPSYTVIGWESLVWDGISYFSSIVTLLSLCFIFLMSYQCQALRTLRQEPYYAFLLMAAAGLFFLGAADNLLVLLIAFELVSIPSFIIAAYDHRRQKATEASLKFFIMGAASTAFFAYGVSLVYGLTGSVSISGLLAQKQLLSAPPVALLIGAIFILGGLGFKMALVPFHAWMPDVLQESSAPVGAFLAVGTKLAVGMAALRFFGWNMEARGPLFTVLAVVSAITMLSGSILGLRQQAIKRLLAYSSISHMGFFLSGFLGGSIVGTASAMMYLWVYLFSTLGAFFVVTIVENHSDGISLQAYEGLARRSPLLAGFLSLFIISLAGIPPLAGFIAKFYVMAAAFEAGWIWLVVVAAVSTVISIGYYFKILHAMYFKPSISSDVVALSKLEKVSLSAASFIVLLVGLAPHTFVTTAQDLAKLVLR